MNALVKSLLKGATLALAAAWLSTASAWAQFTDTLPPTLVSATFTPNPVDVTGGDAVVTLSLHVTDDLSGVDFPGNAFTGYIYMGRPGGQYFALYSWNFMRTDSNAGDLDTVWEASFTVYQGTENGDWTLQYLTIYDKAGNPLYLDSTSTIVDTLTINSFSDTTPPVVSEPMFVTEAGEGVNSIDVSAASQWITLNLHITDDIAGFGLDDGTVIDSDQTQIYAQNSNNQTTQTAYLTRVSGGTRNDAIWQANFWFPQYSPTGSWTVHLYIRDNARNSVNYDSSTLLDVSGNPAQIEVFSDPSDMTPPTVSAISLSPITIDTSASDRVVTATVTVADDLAGVNYAFIYLRSPSGAQQRYIWCTPTTNGFLSGDLTGSTTFPRYSEAGTWKVSSIFLLDYANNYGYVYDPTAAGLDATLNVILPSLNTDGSVDPAGGTIEDPVFTDRASVTIPPGAVTGPTSVAIDVLATPLDVPLPTGLAGANTFYVNIHLDPQPDYPLAPPGLTVVLPLTHPIIPGTVLNLYRINSDTGELEAAIDVFGNPVVGTVDAGGLSATFAGVSRLSTVVGLLAEPVVTWNIPSDIIYGTPLSGLQLNASANLPGVFSYTPSAGTKLGAGPGQTLSVVFTPQDSENYGPVTRTVTINVIKAPLKITGDDKTKVAGEPLPNFTAKYEGFVNGDDVASLTAPVVFSTTATAASQAGTYDINVGGAAASNYDISYAKGKLTVLAPISLKPVAYPLVSTRRISTTVWEYVYKLQIKNESVSKAFQVSAQLDSWPTQLSVIDGTAGLGTINAGQTVLSEDTFKVRIDRSKQVLNSDLKWRVTYAYDSGGSFNTTVTLPLK